MRKTQVLSPLLLSLVLFAAGLAAGVLGLKVLSPDEKAELMSYLQAFMSSFRNPGLEPSLILRMSLGQNLKTAALLWGFGLAVIGAPLTCLLLVIRGFAVGFGSAFLVREVTSGGAVLFFSGLFPQSLFSVPTLIALSSLSISFSVGLIRERPWNYGGLGRMVVEYTSRFAVLSLGLVASSLVEAYISPALLARLAGS